MFALSEGNDPQHRVAISLELARTDATDALQILQRVWRALRDGGQRGVVEDHIRRQVVFARD